MALRKIVRARPHFEERDIQRITEMIGNCLRSGHLSMGPLVEAFERQFAAMVGVKHAIAVNSGTAALEIALTTIDVPGTEVIVPTETFVASANAVLRAGGKPVFAEIAPDTLCLDVADVERRITNKTSAVMIVHMAGLIPDSIDALIDLCNRHSLSLIEDAAHAHGASVDGRRAGSLGRVGCFSFYPTKIITTAEGGMITTDDDEIAGFARSLRNHGANPDGSDYIHVSTNWRMPEPNAAIGLVQLEQLDGFLARRRRIAGVYDDALAHLPALRTLPKPTLEQHGYWNYIALLEDGMNREELARCLWNEYGVPIAWPYDPPCHLQPVFRRILGSSLGDLPQSERILARHIALPIHPGLSDEDLFYVIESLKNALATTKVA